MKVQNVRAMGDIKLESGEYGIIDCLGDLKLTGSVGAESIKVSGDMKAREEVTAVTLSVSGDGKFNKNVRANQIKVFGDANFKGSLIGTDVKIFGTLKAEKIEAESLTVNGEVERAAEISAETLTLRGEFHVAGSVTIGRGSFMPRGDSDIREIFCESLKVSFEHNEERGLFSGLLGKVHQGKLKADLIEGDEIYLENTRANIVRGKIIKVGKGSVIEKVEYSDTLEILEGGTVKVKEEF